jgi:hypothetical protein
MHVTCVTCPVAGKITIRQAQVEEPFFREVRGYDGIPWNHNNAEHAVKSFAELRQTIGGVTREKGLRDYLVLLSLCQTCRYIGLDFLDFLCSGEKDLRAFADSRRRKDKPCVAPTVSTRRRIVSPSRNSIIDEFKSAAQNRAR